MAGNHAFTPAYFCPMNWLRKQLLAPDAASAAAPMRAITVTPQGALSMTQVAIPSPAADEVVIRVAYAGVNRADLLQRQGSYKVPEGSTPVLGLEVSGTIVAIGDKVIGWALGEQVCALLDGGGYSEFVAAPAACVLPIPPKCSLADAASIPEACATAWLALVEEGRLRDGQTVLIHGAAGNIGPMMVQIAALLGARVLATTGSRSKAEHLRALGAHPILYTETDFAAEAKRLSEGNGVDVVIDILGAPYLEAHFGLLNAGGRLVSLAMMEGAQAENLAVGRILAKNLHWSGVMLRRLSRTQKAALIDAVRRRLLPSLATGALRPQIDHIFPLDQAEKAHARMQERLHCGKILLEVHSPAAAVMPARTGA